jgi:hypothetical protein
MQRHAGSLAVLLVLGLAGVGCNDGTEGQEAFQATLSGSEEVPPRSTGASGSAGVTVEGNTVHYSVEVRGISNVIGAHIHLAPRGTNGPIRLSLFPGGTTNITDPTGAVNGILIQASAPASDLQGGISLADLVSNIRSGNAYVNVHTTTFPGGEIRGQLQTLNLD